MGRRASVIGGTGPTGVWIVQGLLDRGWDVTILHRGTHERAETPDEVEHLHHDPYDAEDLARALDGRQDDLVVADDGLTLHHHGYTRNLAHAVLLAVDQPEAAAGTLFNPFEP